MSTEQMTPVHMSLKKIGPEQIGFEQIIPTKINALRNKCLRTILNIAPGHFISK